MRIQAAKPAPKTLSIDGHFPAGTADSEARRMQAFLYEHIGRFSGPAPANASHQLRQTAYAHEQLSALRVATLFIVGEADPIFPPASIHRAAELIPGAQVVEIPGAAHSPYFETPALWNTAVLAFWKTQALSRNAEE